MKISVDGNKENWKLFWKPGFQRMYVKSRVAQIGVSRKGGFLCV